MGLPLYFFALSILLISNLELGKKAIRPDNLAKVCEVLELSVDFVLTGNNPKTAVDAVAEKLIQQPTEELQMVSKNRKPQQRT